MMLHMREVPRRSRVVRALTFLSLLTIVAWATVFMFTLSRAAEPVPYSASLYTEAEWLDYVRERARFEGLVGEPDSEEWALMSYGSYQTLIGERYDDPHYNREMPVFIYQVFGSFPVLNWFGGDGPPRDIVGVTHVFNGTDGNIMRGSAYNKKSLKKGAKGLDLSFIPADRGPSIRVAPLPTIISFPDQ